MFRGLLVLAVLENARSQIDVTALEEFSVNFQNVLVTNVDQHTDNRLNLVVSSITTGPLPDTIPSEHGTIALHARNVQLKTDSHLSFPTPFALGGSGGVPLPLSGLQVHEELHINGAAGQASFHVESPIVNLCFQLDGLPPVAVMMHDAIEQHLQQAEQMGASLPVPVGQVTLDGEEDEGDPSGRILFTQSSHPAFFWPPRGREDEEFAHMIQPPVSEEVMSNVALKFSNYSDSVGSQFAVRACEIESHTSSQSLLAAASPEAQQFILHRIAQHQSRLQGVLRPDISNTHFNLMPLAMADLVVSAAAPCTNEELAQVPGEGLNTLQAAAFTLCSFAMGVAVTFAAISKKSVTPADEYHQVTA